MIITLLLSLVDLMMSVLFSVLPNLPQIDNGLLTSLDQFVTLIFNNLQLLGFFIDINMIKTLLPWVIIVINFEHVYHFTIWIMSKIPVINMK